MYLTISQMLMDKSYTRAVDWWAFGIILYQMIAQQSPFRGEDEDEIYDAILTEDPLYPQNMPSDAIYLIRNLLIRTPEERMGYHGGAVEVMRHEFFAEVDWEALGRKEVTPPFRPTVRGRDDLSNFDEEMTSTAPVLVDGECSKSTSLIFLVEGYEGVDEVLF